MTFVVLKILPDAIYREVGRTTCKARAEDMALDAVYETKLDIMIVEIDGVYTLEDDPTKNAAKFHNEKSEVIDDDKRHKKHAASGD